MARIKTTESTAMSMDMTPMIDVVFQLIIFFMCSIKFKSLDGRLLSYLPKDVGPRDERIIPPPVLDEVRIKLHYDKTLPLDTRITVKATGAKEVLLPDWQTLKEDVSARYAQQQKVEVKIPFIIDPESEIPIQAVVNALDACRQAGIDDVRFAAKSPVDRPLE